MLTRTETVATRVENWLARLEQALAEGDDDLLANGLDSWGLDGS